MRTRIILIVLAIMFTGIVFTGCKSQELCPAYGDSTTEVTISDKA